MDRPILELLEEQGCPELLTTPIDTPVAKALADMTQACVTSVLVLGGGGRLVGIFTERDALTRLIELGRDPAVTSVGSVMTPTPVTADAEMSIGDARQLMRIYGVCHLPVLDGRTILGVLSLRDVVGADAAEATVGTRELQRYIHGPAARSPETFTGPTTLPPPESGIHGPN